MGWFGRRKAPVAEVTQVGLLPGFTFTDSTGQITELHIDPSAEPMTDERYDQITCEIDESKARREAFQRDGQFRGKHFLEWMPELDRLRTEKRDDEALAILLAMAPAADRAFMAMHQIGWGGAVLRIAVIYRRRKMVAEEVEIIEEFLSRHPNDEARDLRARLTKARELLSRTARQTGSIEIKGTP